MANLLANKVVIITGAGSGLGRGYAEHCARNGAFVTVSDVSEEKAHETVDRIKANGGLAFAHVGSVGDWDSVREMVELTEREFGGLDGMVTNAGIQYQAAGWDENEQQLRRIAEINVLGTQFCAAHGMAAMRRRGGGSLVTVTSGARLGVSGMAAYGASKEAIIGMTVAWALDGAADNIRVNALSPLGLTDMAKQDTRPDKPWLPEPEAVGPAVVALLSDLTAGITGRVVRFDGRQLGQYIPTQLSVLAEAGADGRIEDAEFIAGQLLEHNS